ncbi:uncharacterized protein NPIL_144581, partial [Nephila pilipes]
DHDVDKPGKKPGHKTNGGHEKSGNNDHKGKTNKKCNLGNKRKGKPHGKKPSDDDNSSQKPSKPTGNRKGQGENKPGKTRDYPKHSKPDKGSKKKNKGKGGKKHSQSSKEINNSKKHRKHSKEGNYYSYSSSEEDNSSESSTNRHHSKYHQHKSNISKHGKHGNKNKPSNKNSNELGDDSDDEERKKRTKRTKHHKSHEKNKYGEKHKHPKDKGVSKHRHHKDSHKKNKGKGTKGHHGKGKPDKKYKHPKKSHIKKSHENKPSKGKRIPKKHHHGHHKTGEENSYETDKRNRHHKKKSADKYKHKGKHGRRNSKDNSHGKEVRGKKGKKHDRRHSTNKRDYSNDKHKGKKHRNTKHRKGEKRPSKHDRKHHGKHKKNHHGIAPRKDKPRNSYRHHKKQKGDTYHSSEELNVSEETDNNVHRRRHERKSSDRWGNKGDKNTSTKKHRHHKGKKGRSHPGHKKDDKRRKPKRRPDHPNSGKNNKGKDSKNKKKHTKEGKYPNTGNKKKLPNKNKPSKGHEKHSKHQKNKKKHPHKGTKPRGKDKGKNTPGSKQPKGPKTTDQKTNNEEQDYGKSYSSIKQFLEDLTFEKVKTTEYMKKFYSIFRINIKSENIFRFIKSCFQYDEKPANFEVNFKSVMRKISSSDSYKITDEDYEQFNQNLFGEDNQEYGTNYDSIKEFLENLTFEDLQTEEYREEFYSFFHFYIQYSSNLEFIKYCFSSSTMPDNFEVTFNKLIKDILDSDSEQVSDEYYEKFTQNVSVKDNQDYGATYDSIRQILVDMTFDDIQTEEYRRKFYSIFGLYVKTESIFNFFKFCFQFPEKPANFEINFKSVLKTIIDSKMNEVSYDLYSRYINNLFDDEDEVDVGSNYSSIKQFLEDLTFEEVQTEENSETFYSFFHFDIKYESTFNFFKKCFQFSEKPANFEQNFSSIIKIISNSNFEEISENIFKLFTNIVLGSNNKNNENNNTNNSNDNDNNNSSFDYEIIYKFLLDLTFEEVQTEENKEIFYTYFGIFPDSESIFDFFKHCFQYSVKPINFEKNFKASVDLILELQLDEITSQFYTQFDKNLLGDAGLNYDGSYDEVFQFFIDLTFDEVQSGEYRNTFYNYFGFYAESEYLFNLIKRCYQYSEKPSNFDENFASILQVIFSADSDDIPYKYFKSFFDKLFGNDTTNNNSFDFVENYGIIFQFFVDLTFDEVQTEENKEKFNNYFGFYPESKSNFDFIKYCFQYPEKPENFEDNFGLALSLILKSNLSEIPKQFYINFAKNLFAPHYTGYYDEAFKFLKDLTFENAQVGDDWDTFYYYFSCYPSTESLLNFFKFCYRYEIAPPNFDVNFEKCLNKIYSLDVDDISTDLYITFITNLFNGNAYEAVYNLMNSLTFDEIQNQVFSEIFYYYFQFYITSESLFDYIKFCFKYNEKPVNFDRNFQGTLSAFFNSESDQVTENYYNEFMKNLFGNEEEDDDDGFSFDNLFNFKFLGKETNTQKSKDDDSASTNSNDNNQNSNSYTYTTENQGESSDTNSNDNQGESSDTNSNDNQSGSSDANAQQESNQNSENSESYSYQENPGYTYYVWYEY